MSQATLEALKKVQWKGRIDCLGVGPMGREGPPMHQHPSCPECRGLAPEEMQPSNSCFIKSAYGHRDDCAILLAIQEET